MSTWKFLASCALLFPALLAGCGQPREESTSFRAAGSQVTLPSLTVSAAGTVLNSATALAADAAAGAAILQVASTAALNNAISGSLAADDLLLIVQLQGATLDTSATGLGAVNQLGGAGQFELATVRSFTATTITLNNCGGLAHAYAAASHTQIVRVPQYASVTINSGASVTAPAWDGSSGGIVAVQVTGALAVNGGIDVTGLGFRGGTVDTQNDAVLTQTNQVYFSTDKTLGAEKGEGIAGSQSDYDSGAGRYGRGAPANGGGGGDAHNGGGGGGANAANGATYTGAGVMPTVATGNTAWALDSDDIAAGGRTSSSGGGRGGYTYSANQHTATNATNAPGSSTWGGDYRRQVGGRGGHPLTAAAASAVYFGGGGGAGDANDNVGGSGGNGGGLVFAFAGSITGSGTITANGAAGGAATGASNDAPGGGGAGGSIVLAAGTVPSSLSLSAAGGAGGLQPIAGPEAEGPGGGGGGGFIGISGGTPTRAVAGGAGGTSTSSGVVTFPRNGATDGATGATSSGALAFPFCKAADVAVTLTDGAATATAGSPITYTLVVTNGGPGTASVNVADSTPATLTTVSWSCVANASASCGVPASGTGNIAAVGSSVQSDGTLTFTIKATVSSLATGTLTVTGSATVTNTTQVADPNAANNSATDTDALVASADLSLTATGTTAVKAGLGVGYSVKVSNGGPSAMPGVTVRYPLPAGVTYSSSTGSGAGWSCASVSGTVTCTLGTTLAVGAAPALVINATSSPAATGTLVNGFTAGPASSDPNTGNNSASVSTVYSASPDLALTATALPSITAGSSATYSLSLTDNGPSSATGATLSYTLPAGFSYSSASGTNWTCSQSASVVSCALAGTLAPATSSTLAITVGTPASGTGLVSSTFTAAIAGDPNTANNSSTVSSSYLVQADLSLVASGPANLTAGSGATYTLAVSNGGPSAQSAVAVTYALPAGLSYANFSGTGWSCAPSAGTVTCTLAGSLSVVSAPPLFLSVTSSAAASGTVSSTFAVGPTGNDPNTANNSSTVASTFVDAADLSVAVTPSASSIPAGAAVSYSAVASSAGPSNATSIVLTTTFPAEFTAVAAAGTGWACSTAAGTGGATVVTCTRPLLAPGAAPAVGITADAPLSTGDQIVTTTVSSAASDPNPANNTNNTTTTVVAASADLSIALTAPASAQAGSAYAYSAAIANAGPSPAAGVNLVQTLPVGALFTDASGSDPSWSCTGAGTPVTVTCTLTGSLSSGASAPALVLNVTAPAQAGSASSTAVVSSSAADPSSGNNSSAASVSITAVSDLSAQLSGPASVTAGSATSYTMTPGNQGPSDAGGVSWTQTLPAGASFVGSAGSAAGWTCSSMGSPVQLSCLLSGSLAVGGSAPLVLNVLAPAEGGSVSSSGSIASSGFDPNLADNSATSSGVVVASADLALSVMAPASATPGSTLSYAISLSNAGPSTAAGAQVAITLPASGTYQASSNPGWSCAQSSSVVTCSLTGTLPPAGAAPALSLQIAIAADASGTFTSSLAASATTSDPNPANNSASSSVTLTGSADLSASLTPTSSVPAGAPTSYQLTIANAGPSNAQSVSAAINFPAGFTSVSGSGTGWSCAISAGTGGSTNLLCTLGGALAMGNAPVLALVAKVPTATGNFAVSAQASSSTADPSAANNSATATTTVTQAVADLAVSLLGPSAGKAGIPLDEMITVTSAGPSPATNVTVTLSLPAGATFVGTPTSYWTCAAASGVVTCVLTGPLPSGGSSALDIQILPAPDSPKNSVAVSVASDALDPDTSNNTSSPSSTDVTAQADLSVSLSPAVSGAVAGTPVSFTLQVANGGPSIAQSLTLTQTLPGGFTAISASSADAWSCSVAAAGSSQIVTCTLPALASGAQSTVTVAAQAPAALGTYSLSAQIASLTPDPNPGNSSAQATLTVGSSVSDLMLALTGPATALATGTLQYTATVTNAGPSPASTLAISVKLPAMTTLQSTGGASWSCGTPSGGTVQCSYASPLAAGQSAPALTLTLTPPSEGGTALLSAAATSTSTNPNPADASASVSTVVTPEADLSLTLTASAPSVAQSAAISYTVASANAGPSTAASVTLTTVLPAGFTLAAGQGASGAGWTCAVSSAGGATTFTCSTSSLAPGPAPVITITATAPAAQGKSTITASIGAATQDPAAANNSASLSTNVSSASADLSVALTGPASATAGAPLGYSAAVVNQGPSPASNVQLVLPLPAGATFTSGSGTRWTCAETLVGGADSVVCTLSGTLATSAAAPGLSINLLAPAEGGRTSVSVGVGSSAADPNPGNNLGGPVVTEVAAAADLGITLFASSATVPAESGIDFTIGETNAGPSTARAVQVTFAVSGGTAATASGSGWACTLSAGIFSCGRPALAPGSGPALTVHVTAGVAGQMVASAMIASATNDPVTANNSAVVTVAVTVSADLSVTASAQGPVQAQGSVVIAVAVANNGPSDASGVALALALPAGSGFTSASGAGWTCAAASASSLGCSFAGTLAAGASAPLSVTLAAPVTQGAASSQITVSANEPDPALANNTTLLSFTVGPPSTGTADLAIALAPPTAPIYAGSSASLLIPAQNLGPDTAQSVTLTLTLPGARGLTASGDGWTCTSSGSVSCTRAAFAPGTAPLVLTGLLDVSATLSASITTASSDPNPDNNSATLMLPVLAPPDVRLTATGPSDPVLTGEAISYAVVVTNHSGSAASGLSVVQTLPAGSAFVSASGSDWTCAAAGQTVTCTSSAVLDAGSSASLTFVVSAPPTAGDAVSSFALTTSTPDAAPASATQAAVHTLVNDKPESDLYVVEGRGCSTGGVGADGLCLLGLAALFTFAQRRKTGAVAAAVLVLAAAGSTGAQTQPAAQGMSTGIDVQQFKPMPGAADVLGVQSAQTLEHGTLHFQATLNGANDPLGLVNASTGQSKRQIIDSQFGADLMAAYSLFDRLELGAALPLTLQRANPLPSTSAGTGATPSSFGLGDLRLVPKLRLNDRKSGLTFAISMPILLPLGGGANFLGQSGPGLRPRVIAEWTLRSVRFAANLGIDLRRAEDFLNVRTGTAFSYGLAAEASLGSLTLLGRPLLAQATWVGAIGLQSNAAHQVNRPSEVLAALVWRLSESLSVQAGAGPGVSRGYGTPQYRALISISYTQVPPPSDRDHDGIADADDACPDLPGVRSADRATNGCPLPPPDRDHDGIADADDACPDVPGVASPDRAKNGCPLPPPPVPEPELAPLLLALPDLPPPPPDRDHDGIPDALDACPDLAGVPSTDPQLNGCPKPTAERKVVLEGKRLVILEKVHFALAKDVILASSFSLLKQVATTLRDHPEIQLIRIEGHTDNQGNAKANLDLSRRRANKVRKFLIDTGIAAARVQAQGFGQEKPVSPNVTAVGRDANRRVEFNILEMKEPPAVQ